LPREVRLPETGPLNRIANIIQASSDEVGIVIVIAWFYEFAFIPNIMADATRYPLID